ncbi:MAG TPA: hypothetical protein VET48_01240, partial [Steroidobacteraceae bacterium]|nr:hypothetical protein [Steroidobacteraceae bacterium]
MTAVSNVLSTWTHGSCQGSACADKSSAATSATAGSAVVSNAQPSDPATTPVDSQQASLESVMAALRRALNAIFTGGTAIDNVASVATAGLHATVRDSTGIVIHTQEGDTIRIR